jgi:hypothetical protein
LQKYIIIEGLRKDKLELEGVRDHVEHFFDHDYEMTFTIFPPSVRNSKNRKADAARRSNYLEFLLHKDGGL